jgi:hypothetical protein
MTADCRLALTLTVGALVLAATPGRAAVIPITNAGFEDTPQLPGAFTVVPPPGWALFNPSGMPEEYITTGVFNPSGFGYYTAPTPEGINVGFVAGSPFLAVPAPIGLTQVLSTNLQPFTLYTLQVAIGDPLSAGGFDLAGFPGYKVQLLAGGTVLAEDDNSLFGTFPEGTFAESSVLFTTGASHLNLGDPLEIRSSTSTPPPRTSTRSTSTTFV